MKNLSMQRKIQSGEAIDLSGCVKPAEDEYVVKNFIDGKDYCDAKTEQWMWSIGEHIVSGVIIASTSNKFYSNPDYKCLWLR